MSPVEQLRNEPEEEIHLLGVELPLQVEKNPDKDFFPGIGILGSESDPVPGREFESRRREETDDVTGGLLPGVVEEVDEDGAVAVSSKAEDLHLVDQVLEEEAGLKHKVTKT